MADNINSDHIKWIQSYLTSSNFSFEVFPLIMGVIPWTQICWRGSQTWNKMWNVKKQGHFLSKTYILFCIKWSTLSLLNLPDLPKLHITRQTCQLQMQKYQILINLPDFHLLEYLIFLKILARLELAKHAHK